MVDSLLPIIETTDDTSPDSRRKKRRISEVTEIAARRIDEEQVERSVKRWRTDRVQQIYACKLVEALRRVRQRSNETGKIHGATREIRETADQVLAASARGITRWSRAILASRTRSRLKRHRNLKSIGNCRSRKALETKTERSKPIKLMAVERKLKILGRLVPGCRKISVPNLLDEATDYIAALEMQVRAMEALAELLANTAPQATLNGA